MTRRARINRDAVLDAAQAVVDEQGLDAVTMQAVAERLGVTAMALYRHVQSKSDLLDGLLERVLGADFPLPSRDLPWEDRMILFAEGTRLTARRHPEMFPLLLRRPALGVQALHVRDEIYAALAEAGVPEDLIPRTERLITTVVIGFAVSEVAGRFANHDRAVLDADFAHLLQLMRRAVTIEVEGEVARRDQSPGARSTSGAEQGG